MQLGGPPLLEPPVRNRPGRLECRSLLAYTGPLFSGKGEVLPAHEGREPEFSQKDP